MLLTSLRIMCYYLLTEKYLSFSGDSVKRMINTRRSAAHERRLTYPGLVLLIFIHARA